MSFNREISMNSLISPYSNPYAPYWQIGDKKIYNQWEATRLVSTPGIPAYRLVFLEDQYSKLDWTQEPSGTWEQFCVAQAHTIRNKYKKVKLLFSAGRDSGHVWRVFEDNNIPIDELVIAYSPYHPQRRHEYENFILPKVIELCKRHPKMKLQILTIDQTHYDAQFGDTDWIDGQQAHLARMIFEPHRFSRLLPQMDPECNDPEVGYVLGLEKPRIVLRDGEFVFQFLDTDMEIWVFNLPNIEWFYWAPEMPEFFLKQCWMAVNYIETHYPGASPEFVAKLQNPHTLYYDEWCRSVGRGQAMVWECGNGIQKVNNGYHKSIQATISHAKKYDWKSYHSWKSVVDDCQRNWSHCFNDHDVHKGRVAIWGKPYRIKTQNVIDR